jgi:hypothetical protein
MLNGQPPKAITDIVDKISTRAHYHSHGSVIDADEALALGLKVNLLKPDDGLWRRITLLRAMYQFDCRAQGFLKVFEGDRISLVVAAPPAAPPAPGP